MDEMMDDKIIDALKSEPDFELSDHFTQKVIWKIEKREAAAARWNLLILSLSIFSFIILSFAALIYFIGFEQVSQFYLVTKWALPIGGLIILFQWLDQRLIWSKKANGLN